ARVGQAVGASGARYAGTVAANLVRSRERRAEEIEKRHIETAERMVEALGTLKGAAMKIGQLASFIDTDFLPPEYRELYQDRLASTRRLSPRSSRSEFSRSSTTSSKGRTSGASRGPTAATPSSTSPTS